MPTFDFEMNFSMRCSTRGYAIAAKDEAEAIDKIEQCIDEHGEFDFKKFEELGGDLSMASWDTHDGTDHAYEFDGVIEEASEIMKIVTATEITPQLIADLMTTCVEGGSTYWCDGIYLRSPGDVPFDRAEEYKKTPWYAMAHFYSDPALQIEVVDADSGEKHLIGLADFERAFKLMQEFGTPKGYCWRDLMEENWDAITADVWLQLATFGETIYG